MCAPHEILLGRSNQRGRTRWGMWCMWGRREINTGFGGGTGRE